MKVSKWGNSLAIRLPADVARKLGIKEGDDLDARPGFTEEGQVILQRKLSFEEMVARVDEIRKSVKRPEGYKFDRGEANSRGR